jgi:Na+/alanine symporter
MHPHLHAPRRRSAPNAAATADVSHPVKQGLVQSLGMVTDTLVICSATALVILFDRFCTSRSREVREYWVWVCPVFTDCLPLSHGPSSQSNLFVL